LYFVLCLFSSLRLLVSKITEHKEQSSKYKVQVQESIKNG
jgi:hypothetical protein